MLLPTLAFVVGLVACDAFTTVQGMVVDQDGNPISGAVVTLTLVATGRARQMTTGQDGKFDVALAHGAFPGRFDLVTSKSGYEDNHREIQAKTSQTLTIILSKSR
jgi:Carboxypeptidase regulatory-like domain